MFSIQAAKNLRKDRAQFREKLRKLRLKQNDGFPIEVNIVCNIVCIYHFIRTQTNCDKFQSTTPLYLLSECFFVNQKTRFRRSMDFFCNLRKFSSRYKELYIERSKSTGIVYDIGQYNIV